MDQTNSVINVQEKLDSFSDHWHPRLIAELNGQHVKVAKIKGEFVFHKHDNEDELFYILKGNMKMAYKDRVVDVKQGEMIVIPKGVEHKPIAEEEVEIMLFEPANTVNTGDQKCELTRDTINKI